MFVIVNEIRKDKKIYEIEMEMNGEDQYLKWIKAIF